MTLIILNSLITVASILIILAILLFRRKTRRHKRTISLLAWLVLNAAMINAFVAMSMGYRDPVVALAVLVITVTACCILIKHRGNVAYLLPEVICV